jgi:Tfp pilus assembly protein PilP
VTAERSAAREALGRFKVAGILVSDGRQQAFLVSDEGTYLVQAGDTVAERYRVAEITLDAVRLTDTDTQVSTFIPIAGN